jgi:hypothetical protein
VGPGERRTALSVNAAPYKGRRPASGGCPPDGVLRRGPRLSGPEIHLEGLRDASRALLGSVHCLGSFPCGARGHRRSSPCLSDVTGGVSGGDPPTVHCKMTGRDPGEESPSIPIAAPSQSMLPSYVAELPELFRLKRARHLLGKRQKLSALQTEQLIGLSGHRPIQQRLHRIDVGLPRTKASPTLQQLATFTPQDN